MSESVHPEPRFLKVPDHATGLDPVFMQPVRLLIATMLADKRWHNYATICETMRMTPAGLSSQLKLLSSHGYVEAKREGPRSLWRLTDRGQECLADHLDALRDVITRAGELLTTSEPVLARAYRAGVTIASLAERHGLTYYATRERLLAEGVELRPVGPTPLPTPLGMAEAYRGGASVAEVSIRFGISIGRTRRMLLAAGVTMRPKGTRSRARQSGNGPST
ncbi:transcriptional regulator [Amycolatopsis sp. lyj-84]|uniref:transcriptional regulator n=1 Tax=Amycolatopsis sp. lyj-84 TaxID=2789284 RepID=UPI00397BB724